MYVHTFICTFRTVTRSRSHIIFLRVYEGRTVYIVNVKKGSQTSSFFFFVLSFTLGLNIKDCPLYTRKSYKFIIKDILYAPVDVSAKVCVKLHRSR